MDDAVRATLRRNLDRERICPPLIVRPLPDLPGGYQVLDGHQRLAVLRELGWPTAPCFCWPCDDASALILLATLNRLRGEDVPAQRASLLQELTDHFPLEELATLLPEDADAITQTLALIDLDPEALLAELVTAAAVAQRQAPRVVSFAVTAADEGAIEAAAASRSSCRRTTLEPSGSVRVREEEWTATTDPGEHVREGDEVQVVGVYAGRLLKVSSIASGPAAEPRSRLLSPLGKLWSRLTREDGRPEA